MQGASSARISAQQPEILVWGRIIRLKHLENMSQTDMVLDGMIPSQMVAPLVLDCGKMFQPWGT